MIALRSGNTAGKTEVYRHGMPRDGAQTRHWTPHCELRNKLLDFELNKNAFRRNKKNKEIICNMWKAVYIV